MKTFFVSLALLFFFFSGAARAAGCNSNLDCGFAAQCVAGICQGECHSGLDCGFAQTCNDQGICVGGDPECRSNLDCPFAQHCNDQGLCVGNSGLVTTADCL